MKRNYPNQHTASSKHSQKTILWRRITFLLLIILGGNGMNQLRAQGHGMECWMDDRGLWTWGFTDKFAVYDNQTWQYESDQKNGDNRTLVLRNGDERLRADFQLTSDTTCTITVDGCKPQTYRRWDSRKGIFAYLPADNTPPAPCDYRTDTAVVRGYLPNAKNQQFDIIYDSVLDYTEQCRLSAQTDSTGLFEVRLPLSGRTEVIFINRHQHLGFEMWLTPKETYFVCLQHDTPGLMGADSRLSLEMNHAPERAFNASPLSCQYPNEPDDSTVLNEIRKAITQCEANLDSMLKAHPNLSAGFRQMAKELIGHSALRGLGEQMYETPVEGREQTLPGIVQLTDSLLATLPAIPSFISDDYDSFWNWYSTYQDYLANRHGRMTLNAPLLEQTIARYLTNFQMPDSIAQLFDRIETLKSELDHTSTENNAKRAFYDSLHFRVYEALDRIPEFQKAFLDLWKIMNLQSNWRNFDAMQLPASRKDYAEARSTMEALRQSHTALPEDIFNEAMSRVQEPGLRDILARQQEAYRPRNFDYQGSLQSNDIVTGLTDGQEILQRILAPFRGKVVYTDIWGSWCGACKYDMKNYAPAVKEALKGRDVIFLYFANRTSGASWKQIIKEYGCVGPQTVHYNLPAEQQEAVERILLNQGYPSYGLFDKNGKLVTKDAPRPYEQDRLVRTIEELLRK